MIKLPRLFRLFGAAVCATLLAAAPAAFAQTTSVKVGALRTIAMIPIYQAVKQGYFKKEGLDVEVVHVNSGPAVISALVSGSVQIGYSASVPAIFARAQNQPIRIFDSLTVETDAANGQWTWLVASEKSGIKSLKDLAGKTIAMNAVGNVCELQFRDHLAKAGVSFDSLKKIVVPFPQMEAALALGNADAACVVEPFRTNMKVSPRIKATTLASGLLSDLRQSVSLYVLFVREDWGRAHLDTLRKFNRALELSIADFRQDPKLFRQWIIDDFKLGAATASVMKSDLSFSNLQVIPAEVKPLLDGLTRHGMLKTPLRPEDLVLKVN